MKNCNLQAYSNEDIAWNLWVPTLVCNIVLYKIVHSTAILLLIGGFLDRGGKWNTKNK